MQFVLRLHSYSKAATIRFLKNISLLITVIGLTITALVISNQKQPAAIKQPEKSTGSYDKKIQIEQAKKNSILRRFISYTDVNKTL